MSEIVKTLIEWGKYYMVFVVALVIGVYSTEIGYLGARYQAIDAKVSELHVIPAEEKHWQSPDGKPYDLHIPERYIVGVDLGDGESAYVRTKPTTYDKLKPGDPVQLLVQKKWITGKVKTFDYAITAKGNPLELEVTSPGQ